MADELDREQPRRCPVCKSENIHIPGSMLCDKEILQRKFDKLSDELEQEKADNRRLRDELAKFEKFGATK